MPNAPKIESFKQIKPMIYAYQTPSVPAHDGWTKIGYTASQTVEDRIAQQSHTINVPTVLRWREPAMYMDGSWETFTDHDFHRYLVNQRHVERTPGTEWFHIEPDPAHDEFSKFSHRDYEITEGSTYTLRDEQAEAVEKTQRYFESGGTDFLWNAKPRFGKTLTAYDLVQRMKFRKVLIVTNRPSISDSWLNDFQTFIGWQYPYFFVSDNKGVLKQHAKLGKHANEGVMTREEYMKYLNSLDASEAGDDCKGMIAFESLQGLKTSKYFGGHSDVDKLQWISQLDFDLLIVDESQEGVDTSLTEKAFENIHRAHTLYLSGTPFKQLAQGRFGDDQIFNWTYVDEQEAKQEHADGEDTNPYEVLPNMEMYTYRMSDMIESKIRQGIDVDGDGETEEYAFDLNEFFATKRNGTFVHEDAVKEFLHNLTTLEKYPFSTEELRGQLSHTLWILNRVASCKALAKLIEAEPAFQGYKVVVAAGDGKPLTDDDESFVNPDDADKTAATALERVKEAIANNPRTITLSVGQLTVGVTIPEWSGVLMLCNLKSASSYMQAAFRAQNPCTFTATVDGKPQVLRKETAYVFDFDPVRTLSIVEEYAENLSYSGGTAAHDEADDSRKKRIKLLLNFFPVIGEDDEGRMVQLDAEKVMSIPRRIKSQEVVNRRFLCNFLFQNISGIFGAPAEVREILNKLEPAKEEKPSKRDQQVKPAGFTLDKDGEPEIPDEKVSQKEQDLFSDKIFTLDPIELPQVPSVPADNNLLDGEDGASGDGMSESLVDMSSYALAYEKAAADQYSEECTTAIVNSLDVSEKDKKRITKRLDESGRSVIHDSIDKARQEFDERQRQLQQSYQLDASNAETPQERTAAQQQHADAMQSALKNFVTNLSNDLNDKLQAERRKAVAEAQRMEAEQKKREIEDTVRAHLRGFTRTIPSFVMAYGDRNLTLRNFDDYTEDDVFHEVTGITEKDFRFLRDGGDYVDEETGETKHFGGHMFDETVFNDSIQEFLNRKEQLANYFDDSQSEDIFDYIPPQKTNQIFTPRWVVEKMVDELEQENPGCFDDPDATFADLYMKSGMYIAEIVKRLYRSERMKELFPDGKQRIRHIFERQVYGMAPTRIIYLIATNYILGFNDRLKSTGAHFVQADAAQAAKDGTLQQLVDEKFGA